MSMIIKHKIAEKFLLTETRENFQKPKDYIKQYA